MISLAHITQTSGRTIATALLAGGLVAGTAAGNPAAAFDSFGLFSGFSGFGGQNANNWTSNNSWNNNAINSGWNANAWSVGPSLALGAMALSSRNSGNNTKSSSYAQGYQAGQNNAYHANRYNRYSDRNSHWWPRLRNENVIVVGRVRIPFDPNQAQRPASADFQIGQVASPPAGLQLPHGIDPDDRVFLDNTLLGNVFEGRETGNGSQASAPPVGLQIPHGIDPEDRVILDNTLLGDVLEGRGTGNGSQASAPPAGLQKPAEQEVWIDDPLQEILMKEDIKMGFWSRSGYSGPSRWTRTTTNLAGPSGSGLPRPGHEVIGEFSESDPDRPLITGRVYNSEANAAAVAEGDGPTSIVNPNGSGGANRYGENAQPGSYEGLQGATQHDASNSRGLNTTTGGHTEGGLPLNQELEAYIRQYEQKLGSVGDDAQLANVDLQNMLQKQQQSMQMMSNISEMLHDTDMAIIRKIGN